MITFSVTISSEDVRRILINHLADTDCEVAPDAKMISADDGTVKIEWKSGSPSPTPFKTNDGDAE